MIVFRAFFFSYRLCFFLFFVLWFVLFKMYVVATGFIQYSLIRELKQKP